MRLYLNVLLSFVFLLTAGLIFKCFFPHHPIPPVAEQMPIWWGTQQVGTSVWVNWNRETTNSWSGHSLDRHVPPPVPAQNSLVSPTINELEAFQLGGGWGGRGKEEWDRGWAEGVSPLNNLLMGLPSISNFGREVLKAIVTHVSSKRAKKDLSGVTATA